MGGSQSCVPMHDSTPIQSSITPLPTVEHPQHLSDPFTTRAAASRPSCNQRSNPAFTPSSCRTETRVRACMHARLLSSRKASLLQPGLLASTRRLRRIGSWHESRLCPARSYPNRSSTSKRKRKKTKSTTGCSPQDPNKGVRSDASWLRYTLSVSPPRRASLFPPAERTCAAVPRTSACVKKREERSWKWNRKCGQGEEGERPAIQ